MDYDTEEDFDDEYYEEKENSDYPEDDDFNQDTYDESDLNELVEIIQEYTVADQNQENVKIDSTE